LRIRVSLGVPLIHRLIGAAEYLPPEQAAGAAVVMAGGSRLLADEQPA
jgi:hypothetical protein